MKNGRMALIILGVAAAPIRAFVTPPSQAKLQQQVHHPQQQRQSTAPLAAASTTTEGQRLSQNEESRANRRTVFTHEDWVEHRSPDRFVKNLGQLTNSGIYRGVLQEVMATVTIATLIVVFNACVSGYTDLEGIQKVGPWAESLLPLLSLPIAPFTLSSPSLGLLLVFRTNSSYQRWDEARKNWGMNINHSRDLVRLGSAYYDREGVPDHIIQQDLDRLALCTWAFVRSMKRHLSPEWEDEADFIKELKEKLPLKQAEKIISAKHRPNRALQDLSAAIEAMPMNFIRKDEVHAAASIFEDNLGSSERLLSSPVPLFYSRHTARFTALWLLALPFALYAPFEGTWNHWGMIPATGGISLALFGMEELATQLEEPFTLLPMQVYCDKIYDWCKEIVAIEPNDNKMFSDAYLAEIQRLHEAAERDSSYKMRHDENRIKRVAAEAERVASETSRAAMELAQAQQAAAQIRAATEQQAMALQASFERQAEQERQMYQRMAAAQQQMAWTQQANGAANGATAPPAANGKNAPPQQGQNGQYAPGQKSFMSQGAYTPVQNNGARNSFAPSGAGNKQPWTPRSKDPMTAFQAGYANSNNNNNNGAMSPKQDAMAAYNAAYANGRQQGPPPNANGRQQGPPSSNTNQGRQQQAPEDRAALERYQNERATAEANALARQAAAERAEAQRQAQEAWNAAEQARAEKLQAERIAAEARLAAEQAKQEQVAAQKAVARAREQAKQALSEASVARERAMVEKALADRQARAIMEAQAAKRQQVSNLQNTARLSGQQQPSGRNGMLVPMMQVDKPEDKMTSFRNTPFENFTNVERRWN